MSCTKFVTIFYSENFIWLSGEFFLVQRPNSFEVTGDPFLKSIIFCLQWYSKQLLFPLILWNEIIWWWKMWEQNIAWTHRWVCAIEHTALAGRNIAGKWKWELAIPAILDLWQSNALRDTVAIDNWLCIDNSLYQTRFQFSHSDLRHFLVQTLDSGQL